MSRAIDRHRARRAENGADHAMDSIYGDGAQSGGGGGGSDASAYGNLFASLAKAGAEIADNVETKKANEKKAADDKAAAQKKAGQVDDLKLKLKAQQSKVDSLTVAAQIADTKAQAEKEPYGPLHTGAINAHGALSAAQRDLQQLQQDMMTLQGGGQLTPEQQAQLQRMSSGGGVPTWLLVGGGVVGVGGVGYLLYRLFRGKRS